MVDLCVGALSPLLPAFKKALSLSDLRTSLILAAVTFSSSFVQPVFGLIADRVTATWFLWGGVGAATAGLALAGLAPNWWLLVALVVLCGLGVGAYHPEAARLANHYAGPRKASGVAWFTVGGNLGFAIGPLAVALLLPTLAERTTLVVLVPGLVAFGVLVVSRERLRVPVTATTGAASVPDSSGTPAGRSRTDLRGMTILVTAVSLRTWAQFGVMAIAPLYLTGERGLGQRDQGLVIFAFVVTGAVGTMIGARIADSVGGTPMLAGSLLLASPTIGGFILTDGVWSVVLLAIAGFMLMASFSATVVMGQRFMPSRPALAAAWVLGFGAIGAATPWLPVVGAIADAAGREAALWVCAAVPLVAALIAAAVPHPAPHDDV